jgi:UDP-glucose 4-epimerase
MKSVLITGISGFLGFHCAHYFKSLGWRVYGIDPYKPQTSLIIDFFRNEPITLDLLQSLNQNFSLVIHCAGSGSVGYSRNFPFNDYKMNVEPLISVLEYLRLYNPDTKLIFPSSAAVYGAKCNLPLKESESLSPVSPYGFHKLIAEKLCESYFFNYKLNMGIIRFFSLYGAGLKKQLLWDACNKFSSSQNNLNFSGTGHETRDWLHIEDAVSLILALYKSDNNFEVINGGSGNSTSVKTVLEILAEAFPFDFQIQFSGMIRPGDPSHYLADISKSRAINWAPSKKLTDGIKEYIFWYKNLSNYEKN